MWGCLCTGRKGKRKPGSVAEVMMDGSVYSFVSQMQQERPRVFIAGTWD
jgi:hypothetical protein